MEHEGSREDSLGKLFKWVYPFLSLLLFCVGFAVIFGTFELSLQYAAYNIVLAIPALGLSLMLFRRFHVATLATTLVAFALFYIDQFVYSARLTHIRFSDLMLAGQALRVADRYHLIWNVEITRRLGIALAVCGLLFLIAFYYKLSYRKTVVFLVGLALLAGSVAAIASGVIPHESEDFDFTTDTENRGLLYSWYCQYQESEVIEPEGYSKDKAEAILARYEPQASAAGADSSDVNVIVVMNESLTDYSLVGDPVFADPLANIHSYDKNCFEGKLAVSVFGGTTCNTEYEFLTGNAMAFMAEDAVPFLQYIVDDEDSLARELGVLGYSKTAIHPYYSEEWNRTQVYKFLGFDQFISGIDFGSAVETDGRSATQRVGDDMISFGEGPLYTRGLICDQTCYERVLDEADEDSFIFAVTMQNHGGYDYEDDDFENMAYVSEGDRIDVDRAAYQDASLLGYIGGESENEIYKVNQFLTCMKLSDEAFKGLTDSLEKSDQKTIVLMFGDHQPALPIVEDFVACEPYNDDLYYTVPYLLWANYDIEFDAPEFTSPNYLSAILKKNAGLPLSAWDLFRLEAMEEYPVVSTKLVLDKDGNATEGSDEGILADYAVVQYMRMFD